MWAEQGFLQLICPNHSLIQRDRGAGAPGRNLEGGIEAEAMKELRFLAYSHLLS